MWMLTLLILIYIYIQTHRHTPKNVLSTRISVNLIYINMSHQIRQRICAIMCVNNFLQLGKFWYIKNNIINIYVHTDVVKVYFRYLGTVVVSRIVNWKESCK